MTHASWLGYCAYCVTACVCAGACAATPVPAAKTPAAAAAQTQPAPSEPAAQPALTSSAVTLTPTPEQLTGAWTQYWSPAGHADTQRYLFLADGRFSWGAPVHPAAPMAPVEQSGHYRIEAGAVVLEVEHESFPGCSTCAAAQAAAPRTVEHSPAMQLQVELTACPPNEEAEHLDSGYACLGMGGHAFWRQPGQAANAAMPIGRQAAK